MLDPVVSLLATLCGALLFGSSAVQKLRDLAHFGATLADYRLVPGSAVSVTAIALTVLETLVCAALLSPATRAAGALAGSGLLLLYACAMGINLARGRRDLDCGCGLVRRTIGGGMVFRNLALAALLTLPALPTSSRTMVAADYATVVGALLVGVLLYASTELLLARPALRAQTVAEGS